MLIIEIVLTVIAWRKGWRGYALLPWAGMIAAAVFIALGAAASGGDPSKAANIGPLLDVICIGVLVRLAVRGPRTAAKLVPAQTVLSQDFKRPAA